jgi:putative ABC transport system permease protein
VLVDFADLQATGLLSFGSRATYQLLLRAPEPTVRQVGDVIAEAVKNRFVRSRGYWQNADRIGEDLTRAENYLSLVGLVILILGGIGVSSVTRVFVQQKVRSIAILKCLGGTSTRVLAIYMTQVMALGAAGSALGVALAGAVIASVPSFVGGLAGALQIDYGLSVSAVEQGLAIGVLVSLLFSVVPLLEVRLVKPSLLLRNDVPPLGRIDWLKWGVTAAVAASLVGVAAWQAGSLRVGLMLSAGFVATALVLHGAGVHAHLGGAAAALRALVRAAAGGAARGAARQPDPGHPAGRRPGELLHPGCAVAPGRPAARLRRADRADGAGHVPHRHPARPACSAVGVSRFAERRRASAHDDPGAPRPRHRREGAGAHARQLRAGAGAQRLSREFTVTYRPELERNEKVVQGAWWDASTPAAGPEVSIEEGFLRNTRLNVGDQMTFDVLGRTITARVASIRRVDWQDFRAGGFMFVFRPGIFDAAPHTFIASFKGPSDAEVRARMQAGLVAQFPNVSVIDLREILQTVSGIVNNVTTAVTVVGSLVLLSGGLILVGAVSMTKFRRVYEAAILKTLGASSRLIAAMLVLEYGVLGAIAGTVGALGAIALSWAVATYALELAWTPAILLTVGGIVVTSVFVAVVGVVASWDVLRHKPLSTLRAE